MTNNDTLTKNLFLVGVDSGKFIELTTQERRIWSTAWSPDGTQLAISGGDHPIEILNPKNGEVLRSFSEESNQSFCLAWSPDGRSLAAWTLGGIVQIWSTQTGMLVTAEQEFKESSLAFYADTRLAWLPDSRHLCLALTKNLTVWDTESGDRPPLEFFSVAGRVRSVAVAPDGSSILVNDEGAACFWRGENKEDRKYLGPIGWVKGWHSDNRRALFDLLIAYAYDTETFQKLGSSLRHFPDGGWMVIGPEGHYRGGLLAAASQPQGDGTSGKELAAIERHIVYVTQHEDDSRHTYTPSQFRAAFSWQNDPTKATFMALPSAP